MAKVYMMCAPVCCEKTTLKNEPNENQSFGLCFEP